MKKSLCVKGFTIGEGKPLICVPVMAADKERVVAEVKKYVDAGVSMIEWRVDAFGASEDINSICEVLEELRPIVEKTLLVYTYRTKGQGGNGTADKQTQYDIHKAVAKTGVIDLLDVEYFELEKPKRGIKKMQSLGAHVIASHHDFNETPDSNIMSMILDEMFESGADIVKLAVMPNNIEDVYRLMAATSDFKKEYPEIPIITMSMGALGSITRVAGQYFGSCVTFGAGEEASAPGQLPYTDLGQVLDILDKCVNK